MTKDILQMANDIVSKIQTLDLDIEAVGDMGQYDAFVFIAEGHPHRVSVSKEDARNILSKESLRLIAERKNLLKQLDEL